MALSQKLPLVARRRWSAGVSSVSLSIGRRSRPTQRSIHAAAVACAGSSHAEYTPAFPVRPSHGPYQTGRLGSSRLVSSASRLNPPRESEINPTGALALLGFASLMLGSAGPGTGSAADCESTHESPSDESMTAEPEVEVDNIEAPSPAGTRADVDRDGAIPDDDDDPANDEPTSCSICNINRQGPCRRQWLKFERCMKEHGSEREARERREAAKKEAAEEAETKSEDSKTDDDAEEGGTEDEGPSLESQWDDFMIKSTRPGKRIA